MIMHHWLFLVHILVVISTILSIHVPSKYSCCCNKKSKNTSSIWVKYVYRIKDFELIYSSFYITWRYVRRCQIIQLYLGNGCNASLHLLSNTAIYINWSVRTGFTFHNLINFGRNHLKSVIAAEQTFLFVFKLEAKVGILGSFFPINSVKYYQRH